MASDGGRGTDGSGRALLTQEGRSPLDLAIAAWLDAKSRRSQSAKPARAYTDALTGFRAALQALGLDLDSDARGVALAAQGWAGIGDVAPATYNQRLAILSSFYGFAARRGLLDLPNPIARIERRPVQAYASATALDYATVKHQLAAIDRSDLVGQRDYVLLAVALQTGRRLSELAALRWGDVRITNAIVTLQ